MNELISDNLILLKCYLGFLPCAILLILTQVFWDVYVHFILDICSVDTCFKTIQISLIGWQIVKTGSLRKESTVKQP